MCGRRCGGDSEVRSSVGARAHLTSATPVQTVGALTFHRLRAGDKPLFFPLSLLAMRSRVRSTLFVLIFGSSLPFLPLLFPITLLLFLPPDPISHWQSG